MCLRDEGRRNFLGFYFYFYSDMFLLYYYVDLYISQSIDQHTLSMGYRMIECDK